MSEQNRSRLFGAALLGLLLGVAVLSPMGQLVARVDNLLYDVLLPVQAPPMSSRITVVAIDDRSIEALGRFPWSRRTYAQLIEELDALGARAIGIDVLFVESNTGDLEGDALLKAAIKAANVVLPVAPTRQAAVGLIGELLPMPSLAAAATALGHVDVELDSDGLCRQTFLFAGIGDAHWQSFALALLDAGSPAMAERYTRETRRGNEDRWTRSSQRLIPFAALEDNPRQVSFSDVLEGRVGLDAIAGNYVLVGATASGLGDALSTPGAAAHERMPGVVLNAHILNGLLQDRMLMRAPPLISGLLSALLVISVVIAVQLCSVRVGVLVTGVGVVATLLVAASVLTAARAWWPPGTTLFAVLLAWPAWVGWQYQRTHRLVNQLSQALEHQAQHQQSTGLPNQGMLVDRLRNMPASFQAQDLTALMVVHISWEGSASLSLDRPIRDPLLKVISERLRVITPPGTFIAHLTGDDFGVLIKGLVDAEAASELGWQLFEKMAEPLAFESEYLLLSPKIGIGVWPDGSNSAEQVLRNAYTAMFSARLDGADPVCRFSGGASQNLQTRSQLEQALLFALERREFTVFFQPQVAAEDFRVIGAEALLRWNNPMLGWVDPATFIPVAEHAGLIGDIGAWVLEDACRQLAQWRKLGFLDLRLAINFSPLQFASRDVARDIGALMDRTGVDPARVELEITESSLMRDTEGAVRIMQNLKRLGIALAIDDFGTGYSSLSNLREFPLDRLKVDQAFTSEIGKGGAGERIVQTIIAMGGHLGLELVVEGVENDAQAQFLRSQGADVLQGYLFGKPMRAEEFTELLKAQQQH